MSGSFKSIGDRMKEYESVSKTNLMRKTPVIIRLDGKAFHSYTRYAFFNTETPYSELLKSAFMVATDDIMYAIQGVRFAYMQSDEVSILLTDWKKINTEPWFNYNVQKMCSVVASMFTVNFNSALREISGEITIPPALFDARVFNLPNNEVVNYFIWRQQDAVRNSINMLGQKYFSSKELHGKNTSEVQEMLFQEHGVNWNDVEAKFKRGSSIISEYNEEDRLNFSFDFDIPTFTEDRNYIEKYLK